MKQSLKINKVNLLLFICLLLAAILFLLAMDNDRAHRTYLYRDCGIDKRDVRILAETDTHGGFLGDGDYFLAADCSAKSGKNPENRAKLAKAAASGAFRRRI